jgi:hypothetical protein
MGPTKTSIPPDYALTRNQGHDEAATNSTCTLTVASRVGCLNGPSGPHVRLFLLRAASRYGRGILVSGAPVLMCQQLAEVAAVNPDCTAGALNEGVCFTIHGAAADDSAGSHAVTFAHSEDQGLSGARRHLSVLDELAPAGLERSILLPERWPRQLQRPDCRRGPSACLCGERAKMAATTSYSRIGSEGRAESLALCASMLRCCSCIVSLSFGGLPSGAFPASGVDFAFGLRMPPPY